MKNMPCEDLPELLAQSPEIAARIYPSDFKSKGENPMTAAEAHKAIQAHEKALCAADPEWVRLNDAYDKAYDECSKAPDRNARRRAIRRFNKINSALVDRECDLEEADAEWLRLDAAWGDALRAEGAANRSAQTITVTDIEWTDQLKQDAPKPPTTVTVPAAQFNPPVDENPEDLYEFLQQQYGWGLDSFKACDRIHFGFIHVRVLPSGFKVYYAVE